uniref:Peptidase M50B-like protein n=1 Tax=Amphora coffeiformis TaxID=265554 RepID=A0A7S3L7Q9_9STRA|mmetsp:Transcript_11177/g.21391  ORF Transcript_11177/g.21391 Transcript_11177/m.21391 type:complete len:254 (+) Transcript_11177:100-861(+)
MEWFDRRYEGIDFDRPEWAWGLEGCCGVEEKLFLTLYVVYAVVFFLLHQLYFFKPVRLLTVFLHEFGHASACWISGGSVRKIEVYENEGGVTGYTGGCRILVIPAGYVGAAFWGGTIVFLSGGARLGSTICAGMLMCFLLVSLCINPNKLVVYISIFFTIVFGVAIYIEWYVYDPMLGFFTLFFGVFIGFYSVKDIYDDTIRRTAEGSDAVACYRLLPLCHPRCVGVQFWIVAFGFQVLGLYLALVWMSSSDD